jgi:hypothetical protein
MISSLATLGDRNFIIAFLLPIAIIALAFLGVFHDLPHVDNWWAVVKEADKFASLTLLVLTLWSAAVLLSVFNITLFRILEGYTGPFSWDCFRERGPALRTQAREKLLVLKADADKDGPGSHAERVYALARRTFQNSFPSLPALTLPTRFGNVVRSCETYSLTVYGVDCIPAWLRLAGVIPASFQSAIDNARAEVDFFVNMTFLALALAFACAASLLVMPYFVLDPPVVRRLIALPVSVFVMFISYEAAIYRARAWGEFVRSAFDLYLPVLAAQLGYSLPAGKDERRKFWEDFNLMFLDKVPIEPRKWPSVNRPD